MNGKVLCSWIGKINIVKVSVLPKAINRFSENKTKQKKNRFGEISIKIVRAFFTETEHIY